MRSKVAGLEYNRFCGADNKTEETWGGFPGGFYYELFKREPFI